MNRMLSLMWMVLVACGPAADAPPPGGPAADEPEGLAIVDRAIEYHGGDLYEASTVSLTVTSRSGSFDITATRNGGEFDYTVVGKVGRDQVERRVHLTNTLVEQWNDGVRVELDAESEQRARNFVNARIYFPFLPYGLNAPEVYKTDLGIETWEGRHLHKVRVTFEPGSSTDADDNYMYWFDPDTGEMVMFGYDFRVGNGGLRLRKVTSTQRVGGILFSDQENWAVNGQGFSVDQLTPEYVAENMELMSEVRLSNIEVVPLES